MKRPRVGIVDDDESARHSLAALVESLGADPVPFPSGEAFLRDAEHASFECVVTDLRMLGLSGLDLLREVQTRRLDLGVVVVSAYGTPATAVQALRHGAVTFLEKTGSADDLWQAIGAAIRRTEALREARRDRQVLEELRARLSSEERQVLELIVAGKANKQIAFTLGIAVRTVEDRRRRIMQKLEVESVAELTRLVVRWERLDAAGRE